jgi:hypothetical protein
MPRHRGPKFDHTRARAQLYRRSVDFLNDPGNPNGCSYADGIVNPNGAVDVSRWIHMTQSDIVNIGTTWEAFNQLILRSGLIRQPRRATTSRCVSAGTP